MTTGRFLARGVPTPALVVDRAALDRNLEAMAAHASANRIALRPHAKTHKSPAIAARQLASGAVGLAVATLGEAEVFADGGVKDLFVAYPLWAEGDVARRLAALARRVELSVGADSTAAVGRLAAALRPRRTFGVVVEVDCGLRRSGVEPAAAVAVAAAAADAGFSVRGIFTFPGHGYAPGMQERAAADEERALARAARALEAAGLPCPLRSGGSTPTAAHTTGAVVNELRPGVYVFNDAQQVAIGTCRPTDLALAALATVVSAPTPGRVVLDAGAKVLGPDRPAWAPGCGLVPDLPAAKVTGLWEHHAVLDVSGVPRRARPRLGEMVAIVPNHVCTAVNLARELHVVTGGKIVDRWEVAAAGRNR